MTGFVVTSTAPRRIAQVRPVAASWPQRLSTSPASASSESRTQVAAADGLDLRRDGCEPGPRDPTVRSSSSKRSRTWSTIATLRTRAAVRAAGGATARGRSPGRWRARRRARRSRPGVPGWRPRTRRRSDPAWPPPPWGGAPEGYRTAAARAARVPRRSPLGVLGPVLAERPRRLDELEPHAVGVEQVDGAPALVRPDRRCHRLADRQRRPSP